MGPQREILRGSTAMRRSSWSRPVALALEHGVLATGYTFLDFGCGHGDDFRSLRQHGFDAVGWDPVHLPGEHRRASDVVNLGFVLNTIEELEERSMVLRQAHALATRTLIVAVRVDRSLKDAQRYADGVLTSRNTFQKLYTQREFRDYVAEVLGVDPVMADLGVAYVFKNDAERARYVASTTFRRRLPFDSGIHARFASNPRAQELISVTTDLGRLPAAEEFDWTDLAHKFGGITRVGRLTLAAVDVEEFAGSLRERADDILTYLAKLRFSGVKSPRMSSLSPEMRRDVRAAWGSLSRAKEEALVLLFTLGQESEVKLALRHASVGKRVGDALYVHVSALDLLPPLLRLAEFAARRVVGEVEADVIKFSDAGRAVSFLRYPNFDSHAHPALQSSVRVFLPRAKYAIREYRDENPFILHRKELFVAPDYPGRSSFSSLSVDEERAGILGGASIGTRGQWEQLLRSRGLKVEGHRLLAVGSSDANPSGPPR